MKEIEDIPEKIQRISNIFFMIDKIMSIVRFDDDIKTDKIIDIPVHFQTLYRDTKSVKSTDLEFIFIKGDIIYKTDCWDTVIIENQTSEITQISSQAMELERTFVNAIKIINDCKNVKYIIIRGQGLKDLRISMMYSIIFMNQRVFFHSGSTGFKVIK